MLIATRSLAVALAAVALSPVAHAQDQGSGVALDLDTSQRTGAGWYLRGGPMINKFEDTDFSIFNVEFETGGGIALAGGYDFGPVTSNPPEDFNIGLRAEAELSFVGADVDSVAGTNVDGEIMAASLFVNGFVDVDFPGPVTVFAGLGLGNNAVDVDIDGIVDDDDTAFGAQFMLGIEVDIKNGWTAYAMGRHKRYDDMRFGTLEVDDLESTAVSAGVRYSF